MVKFAGEPYEFNFSKFARCCHEKEKPSEDFNIVRIASIALPPHDPLQYYLLDYESKTYMHEREEINDVF